MTRDAISTSLPQVPEAASGMAQRVRTFDWASTPIGPMAQWPAALRIAVGICLNSRFPMFVWWGPQYINIYNDAYVPMLGERHPHALGRPARDSWDDIWDIVGAQADRVTREGTATWNERVKLVMHRHGYEEETWFTWSYSPIYDESGSIGGLFCAVTEETGRVIAERERDALLARVDSERTRLAHAFAHSPAFVAVLKGREHVFEFANARYLELVGGRDILGKPLAEAVPEVVGQGFVSIMDGVYATGEPYVGSGARISLHRSSSTQPDDVFLDFVYQPMRDADGAVQGVLVHGVDVTRSHASLEAEQHARSEAELGNRMKDEFLATLSHELRTPLNAILGWSHMLRQNMTPEQVARGADVIERNARAQLRIIEDLLDMSAIMSGKVRLDAEQIAVTDIARAAIESMRPAAQSKQVTLDVDPAGDATILGDANRLQQVLWNLLSNAVKFTPPGGRVAVRFRKPDPAHVEICVADGGEGIAPEFLPYVFDRFRQADASTTRRHGGLGLGLAIVKQLVELHGGSVRVESAGAGLGASFFVSLPVVDASLGSAAQGARLRRREAKNAANRTALAGLRVLVVDDDRDGRELVQRLLEEYQARVTAAESSARALTLLGESRFDVLVSDIGMPGEDGYELIRKIRALPDPQAASIPALALTAYTRAEDRVNAIRAGFQLHAAKPVDPVELLVLVESLVSRRG